MVHAPDNVIVAPLVLTQLISTAVRAVPGVTRLGVVPRGRGGALRDHGAGIALRTGPAGVSVDCYLVALPDVSLLEVALAAQQCVARALGELAGVAAHEVNIVIQDVGEPQPTGETGAHG